jgi:hypothetical protein
MKFTVRSLPNILILPVLMIGLTACSIFVPKEPETTVPKQALPAQPPMVAKLDLVQSSTGARLTPKGDMAASPARVGRSEVDEIQANSPIVQAAERHPEVRAQLGKRYFFISAQPVRSDDRFCPSALPVASGQPTTRLPLSRLTYYSYSRTAAVIVCMHALDFFNLPAVPKGYQPPESDSEEAAAIRVARLDPRIQDKVKNLEAHVILTDPEWRLWWWNGEGYGHRVFYVTFSHPGSGDPQYYAVVDLSEELDPDKVRQAGAEPSR